MTINECNESGKYRVESSEGLIDIDEVDIVSLTPIETELKVSWAVLIIYFNNFQKVEDTVIASHPHYQATYAPGVIVKDTLEQNQYQVFCFFN